MPLIYFPSYIHFVVVKLPYYHDSTHPSQIVWVKSHSLIVHSSKIRHDP